MRINKTDRKLDRRWARAFKPWSDWELEILSAKFGIMTDYSLAKRLQRSPNALKIAATRKLHLSRSMNFYTARAVAAVLGISDSKTVMGWARRKWIEARRSFVGCGKFRRWHFTESHIERCLRRRPWLCNLKTMPRGFFKSVVQEEYDKNPRYSCEDAAELLGLKRTDDAVQRYIKRGWLKAEKKTGGPWQGVWIIRRSAIEDFLAHDPRPTKAETARANRLATGRRKGHPRKLATRWLLRCPACQKDVIVTAHPSLFGPQVTATFVRLYVNGTCEHGLYVELGMDKGLCKEKISSKC